MQNYLLLCEKIKSLDNGNLPIVETVINEYKDDLKSIKFCESLLTLYKDDFILRCSIIEKKIPRKLSNSNHLNYSMKKSYCSYLFIDYIDDHISILLSNSNSLNEEKIKFFEWIDFFNKNTVDVIFEKILNLLETRI